LRADSDFVAAVFRPPAFVATDRWRTEVRRYEGQIKCQVKDARLKAAATNSKATSNTNSMETSTPAAFPFSNFAFPFSAVHPTEVKNETLQH
jgi:hypothetical protein